MKYFNRPNGSEHVFRLSSIKSNLHTASVPSKAIHKEPCWTIQTGRHITIHTKRDGLLCFLSSSVSHLSSVPILRRSISRSKSNGRLCVSLKCNRQRGRRAGTFKAEPPGNTVTVLPCCVGRSPSHSNSPQGPHLESIAMCSPSSSESCGRRMTRPKNGSDSYRGGRQASMT